MKKFNKFEIEITQTPDKTFVNYWNYLDGDDVVCELIDGKLYQAVYNEEKEERVLSEKEITFEEFIKLVTERL